MLSMVKVCVHGVSMHFPIGGGIHHTHGSYMEGVEWVQVLGHLI